MVCRSGDIPAYERSMMVHSSVPPQGFPMIPQRVAGKPLLIPG